MIARRMAGIVLFMMGLAGMKSREAGRASPARCSVGRCDHGRRDAAYPICRGGRNFPERLDLRRPRSPSRRGPRQRSIISDHPAPGRPAVRLRCRKQPLLGTVVDFARSVGKTAPCMGATMIRSSGTMRMASLFASFFLLHAHCPCRKPSCSQPGKVFQPCFGQFRVPVRPQERRKDHFGSQADLFGSFPAGFLDGVLDLVAINDGRGAKG